MVFEGDDFLYFVNFFTISKNPYKYVNKFPLVKCLMTEVLYYGIVVKCFFVIVWIKEEKVNFFYAGFIDRDFWD